MNEAEYLMKKEEEEGVIRGGHRPRRIDNILRDLYNSSYDTKAEFNNYFIIHSK